MSRLAGFFFALTLASGIARAEPHRIVTLAPSLGELAADLLGSRAATEIVGVSDYTDFPPELASVRSIGPFNHFSLETVASLHPDLALATMDGNSRDQVEHLRELRVPVVVVRTSTFAEIETSVRQIAQALGTGKKGEKLVARFRKEVAAVQSRAERRRAAGVPVPRVLIELDSNPLVVAGKNGFLNEVLSKIGAANVYSDAATAYPRPSLEDAVNRDPDVIVILGMKDNLAPFEKAAKNWQAFTKMKAVKAGKIEVLPGDSILRPTLRLVDGLSLLEKAVYGPKI